MAGQSERVVGHIDWCMTGARDGLRHREKGGSTCKPSILLQHASCNTRGFPSAAAQTCVSHPMESQVSARGIVRLLVGSLPSKRHASASQGRICSDNCTCCHTESGVADQVSYLTRSQYTDTGPTSPSADPTTPGAWQGSHWGVNIQVTGMTRPGKIPTAQAGLEPRIFPLSRRTP